MVETSLWDGIAKPWIELNNMCWDFVYENTFGRLAQIPLLGSNRGFNQQLTQALDAWLKLYPASLNYQLVLAEIQLEALDELIREWISLTEKGETIKDWSQFQQLWSRSADQVFEQAFCSEDNLKVRGKFLNAVNHHRLNQQALMEIWMKVMNVPLRSEVDEIHKNIYDLRKEVKRLKRTIAESDIQITQPESISLNHMRHSA